jgi:ParB/RepB/Spo0J family partition protein
MEELVASVKERGVQMPVMVRTSAQILSQAPEIGAVLNGTASHGDQGKVDRAQVKAANGAEDAKVVEAAKGNPPLLRFELVAGERRLRACRIAGRKLIPAIVRDDLSDAQAAEIALIENVQRSNLNIIEEARGYKRLMLRFRFTEARIAKKVGKSVPTIQAAIKLLGLPPEVQSMILQKQLTAAHGHELLKLVAHPTICSGVALTAAVNRVSATSLAQNLLPNVSQLKRRGRVVELGFGTKFDWRSVCRECPHKAFVTSGQGSFCLLPEEWKKKQSHAILMEEQEAARVLEEARRQSESQVTLNELAPGSYRSLQWNEPPAGCSAQCPCRGQAVDPRDASRHIPVCLDPLRLEQLRLAQREAHEAERQRHYQTLWEGSVQRLSSPLALEPAPMVPPPLPPLDAEPDSIGGVDGDEALSQQLIEPLDTREREHPSAQQGGMDVGRDARSDQIAWNKIAPILVLPILRGENLSYGQRGEWEEKAGKQPRSWGWNFPGTR